MFKTDLPIISAKQDLIGRSAFADFLAEAILNYSAEDPIVVGLFGEWGAGKTSVLNLMTERLIENNRRNQDKLRIMQFNPWKYSGQNSILSHFFDLLINEFLHLDSDITHDLKIYKNLFYKENSKNINERAGEESASVSPDQLFGQISNKILKLSCKFLVIIDDIDRLYKEEVLEVFQICKIIAPFQNIRYLVSMDKEIVVKTINSLLQESGQEYLEKIVQVPFELPIVPRRELEYVLIEQIAPILKNASAKYWDSSYWQNIYHSSFKYMFRHLRDIHRFINSAKFSFNLIKEHLNGVDFLCINALQLFAPEIYHSVYENKEKFVGILKEGENTGEEKQIVQKILAKSSRLDENHLLVLIKKLFPKIEHMFDEIPYNYEIIEKWQNERRVCHPDFFDSYFKLSMSAKGDFSQKFEHLLEMSIDAEDLANNILEINRQNLFGKFLNYLNENLKNIEDERLRMDLCQVFFDIADGLIKDETGDKEDPTIEKMVNLTYFIFKKMENQQDRFVYASEILEKSSKSIYFPFMFLRFLENEQKAGNTGDLPVPEFNRTVLEIQLNDLKQKWVNNFEKLIIERFNDLKNHNYLGEIIFAYAEWNSPKKASDLINELIKTDAGLIDFISLIFRPLASELKLGIPLSGEKRIIFNKLKIITDTNSIHSRVKSVIKYPGFRKLSKEKRSGVEKFLELIEYNS